MLFKPRKLPIDAAEQMRVCPIDTVSPFALMPAPVYAFMKLNEKFVSVKAPLDFFTPEELKRLNSFEVLYFPQFVDRISPVRHAARTVRSLLTWSPENNATGNNERLKLSGQFNPQLAPAPYETSDAVLRALAPLWGTACAIEPFFAAIFTNEFCELLPSQLLLEAREKNVATYDDAVLISGWAVFLALHLGYVEFAFLNSLRLRVFEEVVAGTGSRSSYVLMDELLRGARALVLGTRSRLVREETFLQREDRVSRKMVVRFRRIRELNSENGSQSEEPVPSIFGEGGFADA